MYEKDMTLQEYCNKLPEDHPINKRLQKLLDDEFKLECLEGYGVDNWCGYDDAMSEYWESKDE
jgi:hypothetical protein